MHKFNDGMIQYILWNTCKNNCKFCYWKYSVINDNRLENIKKIIDLLNLDEVKSFERVSLMGGELFDTPFSKEVREEFYKLIDAVFAHNKRLFLMTNLIYDRDIEFEKCLTYIDNIGHLKDTVICTSYDLDGRFHNDYSLELFKSNCSYVKERLPLHIEMILSSSLMNNVINGEFRFEKFFEEYTDNVDFIPPYPGIDKTHIPSDFIKDFDFFPKRDTFFDFIKKCFIQDKVLNSEKFLNRNLHSSVLYYFNDGVYVKDIERQASGNMQQDKYNYIDDYEHSMTEDYNMLREMYNF